MFTAAIWIKPILFILLGLITIIIAVYDKRNSNLVRKKEELYVIIGISIIIIGIGCVNGVKVINPKYETVDIDYVYQNREGMVFGRTYHFKDEKGNFYDLTMDLITYRKIFKGKSFEKNKSYTITYESKTEAIVGIEEKGK